jgi:hypothetical protein
MTYKFLMMLLICWFGTAGATEKFALTTKASWVLNRYCSDCHDEDTQKGDVRLDNLSSLSQNARLDLLNKIQEQIYIKEMPPPKKKKQLREVERQYMTNWVAQELKKFNASKLGDKLRYPDYGNYVDHDQLFSGKIKGKAYTPSRRWLVSPQIFMNRVNAIFNLRGRQARASFQGVTNPIILPNNTGVRYYDNSVLSGGHLQLMLNNAQTISHIQISAVIPKEKTSTKKTWQPRDTPAAFVKIIQKKSMPDKKEMQAAIHAQFKAVLQRQASASELARYLPHLTTSIKLGGNVEGLRQMLVSVILESEFMYRLELGAGNKDAFGRQKLSAREASYAIAYALSDSIPDEQLVKAAQEGKLNNKADYQREVLRILNDKQSFAGVIDDTLGSGTHRSSHPKINRFFREFFGYPQSIKIFKDLTRSSGYYLNSDRRSTRTPGLLIDEADMFVDWHLKRDENVFAGLLTSDEFFVAYNKTPEASKKILAQWKVTYEKLKKTQWETKPKEVVKTHEAFLKKNLLAKSNSKHYARDLQRHMKFFDKTFGQGLTPITTVPWSHGNYTVHAPLYNLGGIPGRVGIYFDDFKSYHQKDLWDYPINQPFKIPNRKGMLTHPAWLIAHSSNFHTDPIKRGRWVREKLLAGRVPDVPITVDAVIPEDHHKTLRSRVEGVTEQKACYNCHKHMNPLGYTFEMYDDFGRYRLNEPLENEENLIKKGNDKSTFNIYKTKAVNTNGALSGTGNAKLDGKVKGALEMIDRMSRSKRVRQSIVRHAFRYFMGRNEMLSDSKTLIDADNAYLKNGGSFKALIVSLLTSDSFIYRKGKD